MNEAENLILQRAIEGALRSIEKIMGPNFKLTLIATYRGPKQLNDADLVMTLATREEIMRALNRHLPERAEVN